MTNPGLQQDFLDRCRSIEDLTRSGFRQVNADRLLCAQIDQAREIAATLYVQVDTKLRDFSGGRRARRKETM